jgi:hypothetical protein
MAQQPLFYFEDASTDNVILQVFGKLDNDIDTIITRIKHPTETNNQLTYSIEVKPIDPAIGYDNMQELYEEDFEAEYKKAKKFLNQ